MRKFPQKYTCGLYKYYKRGYKDPFKDFHMEIGQWLKEYSKRTGFITPLLKDKTANVRGLFSQNRRWHKKMRKSMANLQSVTNHIPSKETLTKASKLCLKNAKQFIDDAKLLISQKSYGHALSLTVLATEEISKAIMYFFQKKDLKSFIKIKKGDIYSHRHKQELYVSMILVEQITVSLKNALNKTKPIKKSTEIILNEMIEKVKRAFQHGIKECQIMQTQINFLRQLEKRKQLGFYVDIDTGKNVISPESISYKEAKSYVKSAVETYKNISMFFEYAKTINGEKMLHRMIHEFKNIIGKSKGEPKEKK